MLIVAAAMALMCGTALADWQRSPASDVDKEGTANGEGNDNLIPGVVAAPDNSCWLATASNMLAGAGYGSGATFQERADDIYFDMLIWQRNQDPASDIHGTRDGGWIDNALNWWLGSANNIWPSNPYTVVTVHGNTDCTPWGYQWGPRKIANWLRDYELVGLGIRWPAAGAGCDGGHAVTPWGDDGPSAAHMGGNPDEIIMADSDRDNGGDFQTYVYDDFTNPNPGGSDEGNGWYFNFSDNHAYIVQAVTLKPTDSPVDPHDGPTQKCVGSYKINQNSLESATDLHYTVYTDYDILGYHTKIDWNTANDPPDINESDTHYPSLTRSDIHVDWDLSDNPVPYDTDVTITTEFILQGWNGVWYDDVYFTYPGAEETKYLQPPYNSSLGTDIRVDDDGSERLLADDFQCIQTGPITKIFLWGSWLNDQGTGAAPGTVTKFHLNIYSDDPTGDDPLNPNDDPTNQYSKPLTKLWSGTYSGFTVSQYSYIPQGEYFWDAYRTDPLGQDKRIWQYEIEIPESSAFVQQGSRLTPKVYWLAVSAEISGQGQPQFGWKTTDPANGWNDTAVAWKDTFVKTDEFNYWEDQASHSYVVSGSTSQGAYDCSGDSSLRIGSCDSGASAQIVVNVTALSSQVKLRYRIPWAGYVSGSPATGAKLYVDGVDKGNLTSNGCNWQELVLNGMSSATADGQLRIKITDTTAGCDGDIQIAALEVYSLEQDWTPLYYPTGHQLSGKNVDMSFGVVTPASQPGSRLPEFGWNIVTREMADLNIVDMTGGYVIGAFDVYDMAPVEPRLLGQYRFVHQYPYTQDPEHHVFTLRRPTDQTGCEYAAANFRFGHLYGMPETEELWQFSNWMTASPAQVSLCSGTAPFTMTLNWEGRLPYPASNIKPLTEMPESPNCTVYRDSDINKDCCVNMLDMAMMAGEWLQCTSN